MEEGGADTGHEGGSEGTAGGRWVRGRRQDATLAAMREDLTLIRRPCCCCPSASAPAGGGPSARRAPRSHHSFVCDFSKDDAYTRILRACDRDASPTRRALPPSPHLDSFTSLSLSLGVTAPCHTSVSSPLKLSRLTRLPPHPLRSSSAMSKVTLLPLSLPHDEADCDPAAALVRRLCPLAGVSRRQRHSARRLVDLVLLRRPGHQRRDLLWAPR